MSGRFRASVLAASLLFLAAAFTGCQSQSWTPPEILKNQFAELAAQGHVQGIQIGTPSREWKDWFEKTYPTLKLESHALPDEALRVREHQSLDFVIIHAESMESNQLLMACTLSWDPLKYDGKLFVNGSNDVTPEFVRVFDLGIEAVSYQPLIVRRLPDSPEYYSKGHS